MSEKKPDGYCAWHPDLGFKDGTYSCAEHLAWSRLAVRLWGENEETFHQLFGVLPDNRAFEKYGWKVVPVKFVIITE